MSYNSSSGEDVWTPIKSSPWLEPGLVTVVTRGLSRGGVLGGLAGNTNFLLPPRCPVHCPANINSRHYFQLHYLLTWPLKTSPARLVLTSPRLAWTNILVGFCFYHFYHFYHWAKVDVLRSSNLTIQCK